MYDTAPDAPAPRRRCAALAVLLWIAFATVAAAQPEDEYHASFRGFVRELQAVLKADDPQALALLVNFPLRINHGDGGVTSLDTPLTLVQRYAEVFTPAVRKAILDSAKEEDFIFRGSDVGIGLGSAWAEQYAGEEGDTFFRLKVINLTPPGPDPAEGKMRLAFACLTRKHRILIENRASDGAARYRVWNRPKSPLEAPDLELEHGKSGWEGSGVCATQNWEFPAGGVTIRVAELACGSGEEPAGAIGELTVTKKDGSTQQWYCF